MIGKNEFNYCLLYILSQTASLRKQFYHRSTCHEVLTTALYSRIFTNLNKYLKLNSLSNNLCTHGPFKTNDA